VVPFQREDRTLKVAMANPRDKLIIREMAQMTKCEIVPYLSPEGNIRRAQLLYKGNLRDMLERSALHASSAINPPGKTGAAPASPGAQWHAADPAAWRLAAPAEASTADLVTRILEYAVVTRASDIHIEPYELETLVRYRIDGVLHEVLTLPPAAHPSLAARIKILSAMRIDEHRIAQASKPTSPASWSTCACPRCRLSGVRRWSCACSRARPPPRTWTTWGWLRPTTSC
jgi:type II secretory ATPase GspE/PulE/Tfp pilus assembly ATPase PilB-like protein